MFVMGTLQPSCAVAKMYVIVPAFSFVGKHVGGEGVGRTVVVGIIADASTHGTLVDAAVLDVEVVDACVGAKEPGLSFRSIGALLDE